MKIIPLMAGLLVAAQLTAPARAGNNPAVGELAGKLSSEHGVLSRRAAAEALGKRGEAATDAVPALLHALANDQDAAVRHHAAWALGKIKNPAEKTIPGLVVALSDKEWSVRHNAMLSLTWIGAAAAPALKTATGAKDPMQSICAIQALLIVEPPAGQEAMPALLELLRHEDPDVRSLVAAVAAQAGVAAVNGLTALLDDKNPDVRKPAIESLGKIGKPAAAAVPKLMELLKGDKEKWNRIEAALALGAVGGEHPAVTSALIEAFDDKDYRVRSYAVSALGKIGGPAVAPLEESLKSTDSRLRRHAAMALTAIGGPAKPAVSALIERLDDSDKQVRAAAVDALGSIGVYSREVAEALERTRDNEAENSPLQARIRQMLVTLAGHSAVEH